MAGGAMSHWSLNVMVGNERATFLLSPDGQADAVADAAETLAPYVPMKSDQLARFLAIFVERCQRCPADTILAAFEAMGM